MPKPYSFPLLFDEVKQVSITKLKEFGFMKPESIKSGRLVWSRRGEEVGDISVSVDMKKEPHMLLKYYFNKKEAVNYSLTLKSVPSNLGIGKVWYFVCPHTGKRCRKLYGAGKYFLHRDAYLMLCMNVRLTLREPERLISYGGSCYGQISFMRSYTASISKLIMQASQLRDTSRS